MISEPRHHQAAFVKISWRASNCGIPAPHLVRADTKRTSSACDDDCADARVTFSLFGSELFAPSVAHPPNGGPCECVRASEPVSGPLLGPLLSFLSYFFGRTRINWRRARLGYSPRGAQFFERALVEQVLSTHQAAGGLPYLVHQHHRQS
jgi:hypothetical protein